MALPVVTTAGSPRPCRSGHLATPLRSSRHGTSLALPSCMVDFTPDKVGLRITRTETPGAGLITLHIQGRVVAEAVAVLERECRRSLEEAPRVQMDFAGVTFIDGRGVDMLRHISAERLRVVNCPGFVEHLLYGAGEP